MESEVGHLGPPTPTGDVVFLPPSLPALLLLPPPSLVLCRLHQKVGRPTYTAEGRRGEAGGETAPILRSSLSTAHRGLGCGPTAGATWAAALFPREAGENTGCLWRFLQAEPQVLFGILLVLLTLLCRLQCY